MDCFTFTFASITSRFCVNCTIDCASQIIQTAIVAVKWVRFLLTNFSRMLVEGYGVRLSMISNNKRLKFSRRFFVTSVYKQVNVSFNGGSNEWTMEFTFELVT